MLLSDEELVQLALESAYDLGYYANLVNQSQLYDVGPAREARDKLRQDLNQRFAFCRERIAALEAQQPPPEEPEPLYIPRKIRAVVGARDVLVALIPVIWRSTERAGERSRAAAFALIQRINEALRPLNWEYVMRPGPVIVLRHPRKRYTWSDETR